MPPIKMREYLARLINAYGEHSRVPVDVLDLGGLSDLMDELTLLRSVTKTLNVTDLIKQNAPTATVEATTGENARQ